MKTDIRLPYIFNHNKFITPSFTNKQLSDFDTFLNSSKDGTFKVGAYTLRKSGDYLLNSSETKEYELDMDAVKALVAQAKAALIP